MLSTAAASGRGVAMLMPAFFAADLAAGRLVQPFDLLATDGHSYWLVYAQEREKSPKIRAFREWILAEVRRDVERAAG
jgi:LysR family transcriptional regulator, glycine cleavage system transcriptional activator